MPDIAMCLNSECDRHLGCYRFCAKPCLYQSYAGFAPVRGTCDGYIPNRAGDDLDDVGAAEARAAAAVPTREERT